MRHTGGKWLPFAHCHVANTIVQLNDLTSAGQPEDPAGDLHAQYATNQRGRQGLESFQCNDFDAISHAAPLLRSFDHITRAAAGTRTTRLSEKILPNAPL